MEFDHILPTQHHRVMDLLESLGFDVSDWANFKGGLENAASNPKYCYDWSFENGDQIVLNIWHRNLSTVDGQIVQSLNLRETAAQVKNVARKRRAMNMDFSIQKAARLNLPLNAIICDGRQNEDGSSRAEKRLLDDGPWYVKSYDSGTGACVLVRGVPQPKFIDQFSLDDIPEGTGRQRESVSSTYERCPKVRAYVLKRADGNCEWCGARGFTTASGSIYLETHHVQPLSEDGPDSVENVIAVCPNDHREAHHGKNRDQIKVEMLSKLTALANT